MESSSGCPFPHDSLDWATDFDHAHPAYNANAPHIWRELRDSGCPVARSERYGGVWLPTRYEDVRAIATDTGNFTSNAVLVSHIRPTDEDRGAGNAPPITSDPPFHHDARRLLLPAFAPKRITPLEPEVRALCTELLDRMEADLANRPSRVVDAAAEYAQHIPVAVIARMLGFPSEDGDTFRGFVHDVLEAVDVTAEQRNASFDRLIEYISAQVDDHEANPRDDLTSFLLAAQLDGEPLTRRHVIGTIILLLVAGIDTTWSAIGSSLWHLAQHPLDQERMRTDPELFPTAVEELLRAFAPVTMARLVSNPVTVGGAEFREGDWVLLPFPAANRDPEVFDEPDTVVLDRLDNRHAAFGLGIHRCIGSNLARLEVSVALEEFIRRFPGFTLADPAAVTWSVGQVRGPRKLPVRVWPPRCDPHGVTPTG